VAQLRKRSSLLLSLTGATLCLTYHQYTIANTTHKLHWHACTGGSVHTLAVLLHAFTSWCGCAMGTCALLVQAQGPYKLWHLYSLFIIHSSNECG